MKKFVVSICALALATTVFAGPSLPSGGIAFEVTPASFACPSTLQIDLDVSSGTLTVGNVTTSDTYDITIFDGSAQVSFTPDGAGNALQCNTGADLVYVLYRSGATYEFMTVDNGTRGTNTQNNIYLLTSVEGLVCGDQNLDFTVLDQNTGATQQGVLSWTITTSGDSDTTPTLNPNPGQSSPGVFALYTGSLNTDCASGVSDGDIESGPGSDSGSFTFTSSAASPPNNFVTAGHTFVPVELQTFDVE